MIASVEGIVLGERLGINPKLLIEILSSSTSANACLGGVYNPYPGINPSSPSSRNYKDGFQTALMKKDIGLAVEAAEEEGLEVEFGRRAWGVYDKMDSLGHGSKDFGVFFQYLSKKNEKK